MESAVRHQEVSPVGLSVGYGLELLPPDAARKVQNHTLGL